jgi:N-acetylglucosamine kinase-like BadF-type ATPase
LKISYLKIRDDISKSTIQKIVLNQLNFLKNIEISNMILLADSGSTKCAWKAIGENVELPTLYTTGINPFFRTTDSIYEELLMDLYPATGAHMEKIYFYGSGIVNEEKANIIRLALQRLYPKAKVELYSDVVAASRSLFGSREGIACIVGTGSNACLYDGQKVVLGISPLGFILGDEGSGAVMGRKLLGDYFKKVMPEPLRLKFEDKYHLTWEEALQRVYKTEKPNQFLASFVPFLSEQISTEYASQLVKNSMIEFFERNVIKIPDYRSFSIGFVGSVAFHFKLILLEVCEKYQLNCMAVLQEPMDGLVKYHLNNNF